MYVERASPTCHSVLIVFSQIIEIFGFSTGYNDEIEIFEIKSLNIGNSKFQKSPKQFCEDHRRGGVGGWGVGDSGKV